MHGVLFVCLPRSEARSSIQARKRVCEYLTNEGFDTQLRFSGCCDYFSIGGRYSGWLNLLRLRHDHPKEFGRFWKRMKSIDDSEAEELFRQAFPNYRGKLPFDRGSFGFEGAPDDAQMMDEPLFRQLKPGFGDSIVYSYDIAEPNVICTEEDCFHWPKTAEEAKTLWVVVVDYHF